MKPGGPDNIEEPAHKNAALSKDFNWMCQLKGSIFSLEDSKCRAYIQEKEKKKREREIQPDPLE